MSLGPRRRKRALVVAVFQQSRSVAPVYRALRGHGGLRFAVLRQGEELRQAVWPGGLAWKAAASLALGVLAAQAWSVGVGLAVAALALPLLWLGSQIVTRASFREFGRLVLRGEALIVAETIPENLQSVAEAFGAADRERPPLFFLQFEDLSRADDVVVRRAGPLNNEAACSLACDLAVQLKEVGPGRARRSLRRRLDESETTIKRVHARLARAARLDQGVALSAEWLLDNAYVIQGHIEDYKANFPSSYYKKLPRLSKGQFAGHPRVYAIACDLVSNWDAHIVRETLLTFLHAFQSETILTSGELWALPMMLRLRLIEHLASLSAAVERRQSESEEAGLWANRLLYASRREPERTSEIMRALTESVPSPTAHFAEELIGHLFDEQAALSVAKEWLQRHFEQPIDEVVKIDDAREAEEQVSLANAISTLRLLTQIDWRDIYQAVSHLEAALWADPAMSYGLMDFTTKDQYRHAVERVSRRARMAEEDVARAAVELAAKGESDLQHHVGYWLVDAGRPALERRVGSVPPTSFRLRQWVARNAAPVYIGSVAAFTAGLTALGITLFGVQQTLLAVALMLLPVSEIAVQLTNAVIVRLIKPRPLPKLSFEDGIPDEHRTLVVVPMMLLTPDSIRAEAERLEIRALGNEDSNLRFCLLADFSDAAERRMPEDIELLDVAVRAISDLNRRHEDKRFLLFYRERNWSESEGCWIGWERKRGKLEDLNRFLLSAEGAHNVALAVGKKVWLEGVRYVLTLDADTQLPRGTARKLVATIAHPLNRPHVSADGSRVVRGYTIIQPRVSTSLPSATETLFTRLFTDPTGVDPYTRAVSDVYQDLSHAASYHGKGIYDLETFHHVLGGRFPDSLVLSHDLLEGAHVRVGLASDIELFDLFPRNYEKYCSRIHRWTRGDWQILDWLRPTVPTREGRRAPNPLGALDRWKVFDNLRRSLVPTAVIVLLLVGFSLPSLAGLALATVVALTLTPLLLTLADRLTRPWQMDSMVWLEPWQNLLRSLLFLTVLPHQAAVCTDAIVRALYRRSKGKLMLEWATARKDGDRPNRVHRAMFWVPVVALVGLVLAATLGPRSAWLALPFAILWALSPALVVWLDRAVVRQREAGLSEAAGRTLRVLARKTWRYFDDYVTEQSHWLPPDNLQEAPRTELAERTSPTNVGLYLLSALAARDFGFETAGQCVERLSKTLATLRRLERYRGHILNWYDTGTLDPLGDKYVSMVDSTNLLACIWTLRHGLDQLMDDAVLPPTALIGASDTLAILAETGTLEAADAPAIAKVQRLLSTPPPRLENAVRTLMQLQPLVEKVKEQVGDADEELRYWAEALVAQVNAWHDVVRTYLPWVMTLAEPPKDGMLHIGEAAHALRRRALEQCPSLNEIANGNVPGLSDLLAARNREAYETLPADVREWLDRLHQDFDRARESARRLTAETYSVIRDLDAFDRETELGFLYDSERKLFAVGFNLTEQRLDRSYYDLLMSEARLGSFLAVARGDVPTEHWWALGRLFGGTQFRRQLLSWSGTMFEFLLPLVFTRSYSNSLLDEACRHAIDAQIAYGRRNAVPWGVSESAFSALDSRHVYQYRAFGVPDLALRRSVGEELVVAPYATALALALSPRRAMQNLTRLLTANKPPLVGRYGLYESIDYSRERGPHGERGVVVQAFMAHHQGMVMLSIDNALNDRIVQDRFHADARVEATLPLLHERIPISPPVVKGHSMEAPVLRMLPTGTTRPRGKLDTPDTPSPRIHLLSNGALRLMTTNAGGGYCRWRDFDISRWRADTTMDSWGSFCYLKDLDTEHVWSVPHQPVCARPVAFEASFSVDKAAFRRRDKGIETHMEIVVSPEDDAEIRLVTLMNRTMRPRRLEVTSYVELALAKHEADRSHPAFSKLFVKTEVLRDREALLAWRRPRSGDEGSVWAAHVFTTQVPDGRPVQFETDRARFIGRGRDSRNPAALGQPLSGSVGHVLDPAFSLRRSVSLEPGERTQFALVTLAGEDRARTEALVAKYSGWEAIERAMHLAWNHAQLELRHLRIRPADAQSYLQLASSVLYPSQRLRAPSSRIVGNRLGQTRLWPMGISGDLPIIAVTVGSTEHLSVVQEAIVAHDYWRTRGLACDLVIVNQEEGGYDEPLQWHLERLVAARAVHTGAERPGGVFIVKSSQISADEVNLVLATARIVFVAARGPLAQQVGSPVTQSSPRKKRPAETELNQAAGPGLEPLELLHFNGRGGFTQDTREYVVQLRGGECTPRPWSNVIANERFGVLVTDEGPGPVWCGNSQANRLTAWSNDPICNPAAEAIYLYDPDSDAVWTPTQQPVRNGGEYRVRHGQGYTVFEHGSHEILQELTVHVPVDDQVRIQLLRLTNRSKGKRTLVVTNYSELVLGTDRESTQPHVVTQWDAQSEAMFARNAFNSDFGNWVAFVACSIPVTSYTADRTAFIGRNGTLRDPRGARQEPLNERTGGALDPCAALKATVELEPGESVEVVFLLGQASSEAAARETIDKFRPPERARESLRKARDFWNEHLSAVQIKTPSPETDLIFNRWLSYQNLGCRIWGRTAFYQSGGAFGFRDQLQDCMALLYSSPDLARRHILRTAARQFVEGDVQHWWHPQSGAGVRTRISDDLLWLPFVVVHYVRVTGDEGILDEIVPFLAERPLSPDESETYGVPDIAGDTGTLLEHCRRAIEKGLTSGPHGLPLIGAGDWNDGLSNVGRNGRGESVWLAWFLVHILNDFAELTGDERYRHRAKNLVEAVEKHAWDGEWYLRGFYDDGSPLGGQDSVEARLDSLPQSWSVISGAGDPQRSREALQAADRTLVNDEFLTVQLFHPPFDKTDKEPGYIKSYPPGVRENGGQYTHAAIWLAMAYSRLGNGDEAVRILQMLNPINHARTLVDLERYLVEPYVLPADVYTLAGREGMGGWTWYTGSAAWLYRVWLEEVLGFKLRGDRLTLKPVLPAGWEGFQIRYRYGKSAYEIEVVNAGQGPARTIEVDERLLASDTFRLVDDGARHTVRLTLGARIPAQSHGTN